MLSAPLTCTEINYSSSFLTKVKNLAFWHCPSDIDPNLVNTVTLKLPEV